MCCDDIFNSALAGVPCCLSTASLKRGFLDIYLTTSSESVISKLENLWGFYFVPNLLKFNLDFVMGAKNWEKLFSFWDNCIWIGSVKVSLLRTGNFSLAANVFTSSQKIWHVNKRDVFQLNWLGSDQWIW